MAYNTQIPHLETEGYKQGLLTQTNPFLEGLLGKDGILGFLENQEKQIKAQRKQELLNQLTRDPRAIEDAINAQNNNRDYRKDILNNRYFVDSTDEDLNKAVDAVNILRDNRIKTDYEKAVNANISQDAYKAGNSIDYLKKLGYSNVNKDILDTLNEYDQEALNTRYKDEILQKIADNQILTGRATPEVANEILSDYRNQYGFIPDRSKFLTDEALSKPKQNAVTARLSNINDAVASGRISGSEGEALINNMIVSNPELKDIIERSSEAFKTNKTTAINNVANNTFYNYLEEFGGDTNKAVRATISYMRNRFPTLSIDSIANILMTQYTNLGIFSDLSSLDDKTQAELEFYRLTNANEALKKSLEESGNGELYKFATGDAPVNANITQALSDVNIVNAKNNLKEKYGIDVSKEDLRQFLAYYFRNVNELKNADALDMVGAVVNNKHILDNLLKLKNSFQGINAASARLAAANAKGRNVSRILPMGR